MAIPKSLKPISREKALKLIEKHTKAGTGSYEYSGNVGDFVYKSGKGMYLLREQFSGDFETGKVAN